VRRLLERVAAACVVRAIVHQQLSGLAWWRWDLAGAERHLRWCAAYAAVGAALGALLPRPPSPDPMLTPKEDRR
jgi:hypothetical protein